MAQPRLFALMRKNKENSEYLHVLNLIKWLLPTLIILSSGAFISAWIMLNASLPSLDGERTSPAISAETTLQRDSRGHAIVSATNVNDAMYTLGFAHAQDRFLQMDLARRYAAGELAEWFGKGAIKSDENMRFHQFRQRAKNILNTLPKAQLDLLDSYTQGVNDALADLSVTPYEYVITSFPMQPWQNEDSILVVFSMYADLQLGQVQLDLARTRLRDKFGAAMAMFFNLPSPYQAALDGSLISSNTENAPPVIPPPTPLQAAVSQPNSSNNEPDNESDNGLGSSHANYSFAEPLPVGSNNWAVGGSLTRSGAGMLANDMHLSLRVPTTWYRTTLNYTHQGQQITVHGVSLPGSPGIVVGTNDYIAWGFTNANLDNVDWIRLAPDTQTTRITEVIKTPQGEHQYTFEMSDFGPVKQVGEHRFALRWVAHTDYAVNFNLYEFAQARTVNQALNIAASVHIPTQNLVVVDRAGNLAWRPLGAVTSRPYATSIALNEAQLIANDYDALWQTPEHNLPSVVNPDDQRLWTANARVIGTHLLPRFGDGGYALGARQQQIRDRLYEHTQFDENTFNAILFDNEARFLFPWQQHLVQVLEASATGNENALSYLRNWQQCACADSIGYTLVRRYRTTLMNKLFGNILAEINNEGVNPNGLTRQLEPALWTLIQQQPSTWLPDGVSTWSALFAATFIETLAELHAKHGTDWQDLAWGKVNQLTINHPFAAQLPFIGNKLNMPVITGYGDSFMPAVQHPKFGASERFIAQPGQLQRAFLSIPGGQSLHPLSDYYDAGFDDYAKRVQTPLLPQPVIHTLCWRKKQ